jgi:hypothetical protein
MTKSVTVTRTLSATTTQVWQAISSPNHLERTHPFCQANPVHRWPGLDAKDTLVYYNGLTYQRHFTRWLEGEGFDLDIGPNGQQHASVSWRIQTTATGSSLSISIHPNLSSIWPVLPAFIRQLGFQYLLAPALQRYLDSVLRGVEYHLMTGQSVRRNQFGSHWLFSAQVRR